ncbi:L-serine ammonia-lyase, iron-sulfur-dependent, subunit alpha [uncultured Brachyspira sp.]|uniref:L-cysteine desulfidase family protein n=1 Tax=uncultured Brachyspira sp. TaxID=221953 RepID=UPI00260DE216|nr:L-serine ammonia-lyase, iron-sulfur-dependent, subunit alpha [uncultured Brachyspira sp.]
MNNKLYRNYIDILKEELIPALGCTEPIAIAYAGAKIRDVVGEIPDSITVKCSGNIIKNVKGVTVPNSGGLKGIDIAAVLGLIGGDSNKNLEVLSTVKEEDIDKTKELVKNGFCNCDLIEGSENLHIIIEAKYKNTYSSIEIKNAHTNITKIIKDGKEIFTSDNSNSDKELADRESLKIKEILNFANEVNIEDIREIISRQIDMNTAISKEGIKNEYGSCIGRTLLKYYGDDIRNKAKAYASAGSDARMGGCPMPVVTNSGSGNQGITVSVPVIQYAEYMKVSEEKLYRALVLSNLIAILQKKHIGKLSAFCGVVCAATGAASGIAYLHDADYKIISDTITNALCTIGGMVCDGAKASCASKISEAVDCGILAFNLARDGKVFKSGDGLVKDDIEATIDSIGRMAKEGMKGTDIEILNIMIDK